MVNGSNDTTIGQFDVIVIGLGGMGSAAAYQLAKRGKRVLGLEQFQPAHANGSSHGSTRIIRQSAFEDPAYGPLGMRAYELWKELEEVSSRKIVTRTGGVFVGSPKNRTVAKTIESARQNHVDHEVFEGRELERRYPQLRVPSGQIAYFEPGMGVVSPEETILAHHEVAKANGAKLHFNEAVAEWSVNEENGNVRVVTDSAEYTAEKLVIASGAWAPRLLGDIGVEFEIERHWMFWFEPESDSLEEFRVGRFPLFNLETDDGTALSCWPAFGEETRLKATFIEGAAELCTPETMNEVEVSQGDVELMAETIKKYVPDAAGKFLEAGACMYTNAPDCHFVISTHPKHRNVALAAGMSGQGYKYAPVVGEILADLAIEGRTRHNIELFDPKRFAK